MLNDIVSSGVPVWSAQQVPRARAPQACIPAEQVQESLARCAVVNQIISITVERNAPQARFYCFGNIPWRKS